jgi:Peptidase family M23
MRYIYDPGRQFRLTSLYGDRRDPSNQQSKEFHAGADYAAPAGTPIPAATSGVVVYSGRNSGFGNTVIVRNATGDYSLYAHMQDGDRVKVGQSVWPGDAIGRVGSTGNKSTGSHLHYSVITAKAGSGVQNSELPRDGGPIGVKVNRDNTIDPAKYDPAPYLDESTHLAQIMSGGNANPAHDLGYPFYNPFSISNPAPAALALNASAAPNWFDDRFGKWGSTPTAAAPPAASNAPANFDERFGNWGSNPASGAGDGGSPAVAAPSTANPPAPPPVLGLVSGQPMRFDFPPSIFGLPDKSSSTGDDDWRQFWSRMIGSE